MRARVQRAAGDVVSNQTRDSTPRCHTQIWTPREMRRQGRKSSRVGAGQLALLAGHAPALLLRKALRLVYLASALGLRSRLSKP
jgi:hypothetical protein